MIFLRNWKQKNLTVNCQLVNGNHPNFNISQCLLVPLVQDFQTFLGIKQVTEWEKKTVPKKAGFKQLTKHDMTYNVHIEREEQKCVFHLKDLAKHVKTSIPTEKYPV